MSPCTIPTRPPSHSHLSQSPCPPFPPVPIPPQPPPVSPRQPRPLPRAASRARDRSQPIAAPERRVTWRGRGRGSRADSAPCRAAGGAAAAWGGSGRGWAQFGILNSERGKAFSLGSLVWKRCLARRAELCRARARREETEPIHGRTSPYLMEAPAKQRGGLAKPLIESLSRFQLIVRVNFFPLTSGFRQTLPRCKTALCDESGPAQGLGLTSYRLVFHQKDHSSACLTTRHSTASPLLLQESPKLEFLSWNF